MHQYIQKALMSIMMCQIASSNLGWQSIRHATKKLLLRESELKAAFWAVLLWHSQKCNERLLAGLSHDDALCVEAVHVPDAAVACLLAVTEFLLQPGAMFDKAACHLFSIA